MYTTYLVCCPVTLLLIRFFPSTTTHMANTIRASVIQACTAAYSLPDTLDRLETLIRLAKERDGTQLAVFPEAL